MKRLILPAICLVVGIAIGWYFGYTRPALHAMHLYQEVQKVSGLSDTEMASYGKEVQEAFAAIKRKDESVAMVSLKGIGMLDRGDTEAAKKYLAYWVGSYYRVYHANGDTNLIARIEQVAATNAEVAAEIAKKK